MMAYLERQNISSKPVGTDANSELEDMVLTNLKGKDVTSVGNGMGREEMQHVESGDDKNGVKELAQHSEEFASKGTAEMTCGPKQGSDYDEDSAGDLLAQQDVVCLFKESVAEEEESRDKAEMVLLTKPKKITPPNAFKGQILASKCAVQAIAGESCLHKERENTVQKRAAENRNNINKASLQRLNTVGPSRSNYTIARPFALATDRRARGGPVDNEAGRKALRSHGLNGPSKNLFCKDPQVLKNVSHNFFVAKSLHSESIKQQEKDFGELTLAEGDHDKKDIVPLILVESGSQAPRPKTNVHSSATGFNFRSGERAQKRKEFYSKLQEKFNAKQEEKTQMQAKTQQEYEEAIKVLRRSLTFKASPMPSFYEDGPPPKVELKKIPTTRPKSPKFNTRSSRTGSETGSNEICRSPGHEVEHSSSDSLQKPVEGNVFDVPCKSEDGNAKKPIMHSLSKPPAALLLAFKSTVKNNESELPVSNEEGAHAAGEENEGFRMALGTESQQMVDNAEGKGTGSERTKTKKSPKGTPAKANPERPKGNGSNNVLKSCANMGSSISTSNKMKPKVQPLPYNVSEDLSLKTSKGTKKERLKALTPYFRKRESLGNVRQLAVANQNVAVYVDADATLGI